MGMCQQWHANVLFPVVKWNTMGTWLGRGMECIPPIPQLRTMMSLMWLFPKQCLWTYSANVMPTRYHRDIALTEIWLSGSMSDSKLWTERWGWYWFIVQSCLWSELLFPRVTAFTLGWAIRTSYRSAAALLLIWMPLEFLDLIIRLMVEFPHLLVFEDFNLYLERSGTAQDSWSTG